MLKQRKSSQDQEPLTFHGLADASGLESLMTYDERQVPLLLMRTHVYRYRHCMYFQARLDKTLFKKLDALMKKDACAEALNLLKAEAEIINIPKEFLDSWALIPDKRLDPFKNYAKRS
ncbi:hypothetical protein GWN26_12895 [Candidatus Saccharibacteria bacterium]|nr:hypothetical protein [Calditrichia bacterium]NIV72791.1 hypothetical protein [Calditrichia bacterium]NIV99962.1 hypothetical protein [Candidatus Saccharibacteria bacterium]